MMLLAFRVNRSNLLWTEDEPYLDLSTSSNEIELKAEHTFKITYGCVKQMHFISELIK